MPLLIFHGENYQQFNNKLNDILTKFSALEFLKLLPTNGEAVCTTDREDGNLEVRIKVSANFFLAVAVPSCCRS